MPRTQSAARKSAPVPPLSPEEMFSVDELALVPLLQGMSAKGLETARKVIKRQVLSADELLVAEDAAGDTMFMLMEGAAKITVRKGANTVLLGLCGPGELLGELAAIDGQVRSATVVAQTPCLVGALTSAHFWAHLWPLEPIPMNLAHLLAERVRRLTAKVQALGTLSVRARLAFQLVLLARQHANTAAYGDYVIPFGLTQIELAQMVGSSRVQINQQMTEWGKAGILSTTRTSLVIHHLGELCELFPAALDTTSSLSFEHPLAPIISSEAALPPITDSEGMLPALLDSEPPLSPLMGSAE